MKYVTKRAKGLEPSTFSLEGYQHRMEVPHEQGPTGGSANACTNACTDETKSDHANDDERDFSQALAMIAELPLTYDEKAEAVRRLLAQDKAE